MNSQMILLGGGGGIFKLLSHATMAHMSLRRNEETVASILGV